MRLNLNRREEEASAQTNLPLFDWGQAQLPFHSAPPAGRAHEWLWRGSEEDIGSAGVIITVSVAPTERQLLLPFVFPSHANVVRIVPRHYHAFLDNGVHDCFYHLRGLAKVALKLEAAGIWMIGHLVQLTDEEMRAFPFMTERALNTMQTELARFRLGFGTRVPWWNRRYNFPARRNF